MATPGFPPPFGAPSGPNTATPSEADIDPGARFLSRYLEETRRIGRSCRREDCLGGGMQAGRHRLAPSSGDVEEAQLRVASKEEGTAR